MKTLNCPLPDQKSESQQSSRSENPAGLTPLPDRVDHLIVVRESNESDSVLMTGMIQQTLATVADLPHVDQVQELGIMPLTAPEKLPDDVHYVEQRHGRSQATLFVVGGIYYLYSMSSAAKANDRGENDFSELLVSNLEALRPRNVHVASLNRLVRAFEHATLVQHAIQRHVDVVHTGETKLEMKGSNSSHGHILWTTLLMIAASERTSIVQRLTAGLVAKYRRGEWLWGRRSVPLGYRLDERLHLVPNPATVDQAKLVWSLLADSDLTLADIQRRIAHVGITTERVKKKHGDSGSIEDLSDPRSFLKRVLRYERMYATGRHTIVHANPFPGIHDLAGLPVHYDDGDPNGQLRFAYEVPTLGIDPDVLATAASVRAASMRPPRSGAAAARSIPPLNGISWQDKDLEFWLRGVNPELYEIRCRRTS